MKKLLELMKYQFMFIHELRDTDAIDNEEEIKYLKLIEEARKEIEVLKSAVAWIQRAYVWFQIQDSISVNSTAYKELEEIAKKV